MKLLACIIPNESTEYRNSWAEHLIFSLRISFTVVQGLSKTGQCCLWVVNTHRRIFLRSYSCKRYRTPPKLHDGEIANHVENHLTFYEIAPLNKYCAGPLSYRQDLYRSRGYHSAFHLVQGNLNYNSYIRYRYHIRPSKTRKQSNRKASGDRTLPSAETSTHGIIFPPKDGTDPRTPPFGGVTLSKRKQTPESWSGSGGIPSWGPGSEV
jgi:hypothetical protein